MKDWIIGVVQVQAALVRSSYLLPPQPAVVVYFLQAGALFFAPRTPYFGLFWPIWAILLQIYALYGALLQG